MNRHFIPDKHKRIREKHEKNHITQPTKNQPAEGLYFVFPFLYVPNDEARMFSVNYMSHEKSMKILNHMEDQLGVEFRIYESAWSHYDVKPQGKVSCHQVREAYKEALHVLF